MQGKISMELSFCQAETGFSLDELAGVLAIELPKEDFQMVSEQEKHGIEERMEKAEKVARIILKRFANAGAWEGYW